MYSILNMFGQSTAPVQQTITPQQTIKSENLAELQETIARISQLEEPICPLKIRDYIEGGIFGIGAIVTIMYVIYIIMTTFLIYIAYLALLILFGIYLKPRYDNYMQYRSDITKYIKLKDYSNVLQQQLIQIQQQQQQQQTQQMQQQGIVYKR